MCPERSGSFLRALAAADLCAGQCWPPLARQTHGVGLQDSGCSWDG